jgi:nitrous oxide reductase
MKHEDIGTRTTRRGLLAAAPFALAAAGLRLERAVAAGGAVQAGKAANADMFPAAAQRHSTTSVKIAPPRPRQISQGANRRHVTAA